MTVENETAHWRHRIGVNVAAARKTAEIGALARDVAPRRHAKCVIIAAACS
jgi:hypothetical protein